MKFQLHIRRTKENAHNNFQILFFIRTFWKKNMFVLTPRCNASRCFEEQFLK